MSSTPAASEVWNDASLLAQALDPGAGLVRVLRLTREAYRNSSFLDDRLLKEGHQAYLLKWTEVEEARPEGSRSDARWIFHIGHVGSTLISRLLGEMRFVLAVREPRALRDLTFFPPKVRDKFVLTLRALMSRTFAQNEYAIIKATSMVSEIAAELVGRNGRALFLFAEPETYIRTILAGENSPAELQTLAEFYRRRAMKAQLKLGDTLSNEAAVAALVWACEMTALESAAAELPSESVKWLDFEEFLRDPVAHLRGISDFFGLPFDPEEAARIAFGPLMGRYSKALDFDFGPERRRQLLAEAGDRHSMEIAAALAMLNQAAEKAPQLARALCRSTSDL